MYLPAYYDDPVAEYWALVNDVTPAPPRHAGARWPGLPWMRMPSQTRPGSRVVTSWTSQVLPSGSVKEQNDP
jgi:hypothetical protein